MSVRYRQRRVVNTVRGQCECEPRHPSQETVYTYPIDWGSVTVVGTVEETPGTGRMANTGQPIGCYCEQLKSAAACRMPYRTSGCLVC